MCIYVWVLCYLFACADDIHLFACRHISLSSILHGLAQLVARHIPSVTQLLVCSMLTHPYPYPYTHTHTYTIYCIIPIPL